MANTLPAMRNCTPCSGIQAVVILQIHRASPCWISHDITPSHQKTWPIPSGNLYRVSESADTRNACTRKKKAAPFWKKWLREASPLCGMRITVPFWRRFEKILSGNGNKTNANNPPAYTLNKGICRSVTSSEKGMEEDENHCYTFAALSCAGIAAAVRSASQVRYIWAQYVTVHFNRGVR